MIKISKTIPSVPAKCNFAQNSLTPGDTWGHLDITSKKNGIDLASGAPQGYAPPQSAWGPPKVLSVLFFCLVCLNNYSKTRSSGALRAPTSSLLALRASFGPSGLLWPFGPPLGPSGLLLALWIGIFRIFCIFCIFWIFLTLKNGFPAK